MIGSWRSLVVMGICACSTLLGEDTTYPSAGPTLTVYSQFGYVKQIQTIALIEGEGNFTLPEISSLIVPSTISIRPIDQDAALAILQQSYQRGGLTERNLLNHFIGQTIQVENWNFYQDRKDSVDAILLNNTDAGPILQINDKVYIGYPGIKVLPSLPEGMAATPSLSMHYRNDGPAQRQVEISYLTGGLSWSADYALNLDQKGLRATLEGWATVSNMSGKTYTNAHIDLVAGDVNASVPTAPEASFSYDASDSNQGVRMYKAERHALPAQNLAEYHFYSLPSAAILRDGQDTQVGLLQGSGINIQKEYISVGSQGYYSARYPDSIGQPVETKIHFINNRTNNLSVPMPAGVVRVFQEMENGSVQFIGEQSIPHTPEDEEVVLTVGKAFNLLVERTQLSFEQVTSKMQESEWVIKVKNRKDEDVVVGLIETSYGNWEILNSTHTYTKQDATSFRIDVPVPNSSEVTVRYKVRATY